MGNIPSLEQFNDETLAEVAPLNNNFEVLRVAVNDNDGRVTSLKNETSYNISNLRNEIKNSIETVKSSLEESLQGLEDLPHIIKVSDKSLLPSFYIIYSNGLCLQGGSVTVPASLELKLLIPYLDTKYNASASTTNWEWEDSNGTITEKTKSTIKFKALRWYTASATANATLKFDWHTLGYVNLEEVLNEL